MKRRIYIFLIATLFVLSGCIRDGIVMKERIPDGTPVTLTIGFGSSQLHQVTVGTKGESSRVDESYIHNVYVLIFDNNDSGRKIYGRYFSFDHKESSLDDLEASIHECWYVANKTLDGVTPAVEQTVGAVKISTVSRPNCTLVLLTNVPNTVISLDGEDDLTRLNAVQNYNELRGIKVQLEQDILNRRNMFLMLGELTGLDTGDMKWNKDAPEDDQYNPAFRVTLKPLDAKVQFKVKASTLNVSSVVPQTWRAFNLPSACFLYPDYEGTLTSEDIHYFNSEPANFEKNVIEDGDEYNIFTFYMLESSLTPKQQVTSYNQREKQIKTPDPLRPGYVVNGAWEYANDNSPYVQFDMILNLKEGAIADVRHVTANATFTVHLGDFGSSGLTDLEKWNNYTTLRSHEYIYDITIYNTENIYIEVQNDIENQPGQEGFLLLTTDEIVNSDAHYEYHAMTFEYNEELDPRKFSWYVKTPFGQGGPVEYDPATYTYDISGLDLDFLWVKFAVNDIIGGSYTEKRKAYPGDTAYHPEWHVLDPGPVPRLMDINQMISLFFYQNNEKKAGRANIFKDGVIRFTAFVDEYYYTEHPLTHQVMPNLWKEFVNADPREMHILSDSHASQDRMSDLIYSSHSIIQQSIQTIYNINSPDLNTIWGCEHTDEMRQKSDGWRWGPVANNKGNNDKENGRINSAKLWDLYSGPTQEWETYMKYDVINSVPELKTDEDGPSYTNYQLMMYSCLTRNRDNNGNGEIDANEIRWYLASINQVLGMCVGNESLSKGAQLYQPEPGQWRAHIISSSAGSTNEGPRLCWAEEGMSTQVYVNDFGTQWWAPWPSDEAAANRAQSVRCVRNIGTFSDGGVLKDISDAPYNVTPDRYFTVNSNADGTFTFNFARLDSRSLREFSDGELPFHDERSPYNHVYLEFVAQKLADDVSFTPIKVGEINTTIDAEGYNRFCPEGYRLPNQKELILMAMYIPITGSYFSPTSARFPGRTYYSRAYFGGETQVPSERTKAGWIYGNHLACAEYTDLTSKTRCVRDVDYTGDILGQISVSTTDVSALGNVDVYFNVSTSASAFSVGELKLCYTTSAGRYKEDDIPLSRSVSGHMQYNEIQTVSLPSLSYFGFDDLPQTIAFKFTVTNIAGNTSSFEVPCTLKAHVTADVELLPGNSVSGFPVKVTAHSNSQDFPISGIRLYKKEAGDADYTVTSFPVDVDRTVDFCDTVYVYPSYSEGDVYSFYVEADCTTDGTTIGSKLSSMQIMKKNYCPNGDLWKVIAEDMNFPRGDFIETNVIFDTVNRNKEGVISFGSNVDIWTAAGEYNIHMNYTKNSRSMRVTGCKGTASDLVTRSNVNAANTLVRLSYDGLYFENERWTRWSNNGNAAQAWIVNPENLTDIEVGQTEGTSHSYHTYEWLRVVHNNVDR